MQRIHINESQYRELWDSVVAHDVVGKPGDDPASIAFCKLMESAYEDLVRRFNANGITVGMRDDDIVFTSWDFSRSYVLLFEIEHMKHLAKIEQAAYDFCKVHTARILVKLDKTSHAVTFPEDDIEVVSREGVHIVRFDRSGEYHRESTCS